MRDSASLILCPGCVTVLESGPSPCGHCGLHRDWIEGIPQFAEALRPTARDRTCRLEIQARWPGGETDLSCDVPGELDLSIPAVGLLRIRLPEIGHPLEADRLHQPQPAGFGKTEGCFDGI